MLRPEQNSGAMGGELLASVTVLTELATRQAVQLSYHNPDTLGGAVAEFPQATTGAGQTNGTGRPTTGTGGTVSKPTTR